MYEEAENFIRKLFILTYFKASKRGRAIHILKNKKQKIKSKIYKQRQEYQRKRNLVYM